MHNAINFDDISSGNSYGLNWTGSTDWAKIYYKVESSDKGTLVLDIGDDANASIAFAQNGTIKSRIDSNGNFSGNAATATNATNATNDSAGSNISSTYLKKTGGTITGDILIGTDGAGGKLNGSATNGGKNSILIGDDAWLGDCNVDGTIALKASNSTTTAGIYFYGSNDTFLGNISNGHASADLALSGGTMTGAINMASDLYASGSSSGGAINMKNSDIVGANAIVFGDNAERGEGLIFYNSNGRYDSIRMEGGRLKITTNSTNYGCSDGAEWELWVS